MTLKVLITGSFRAPRRPSTTPRGSSSSEDAAVFAIQTGLTFYVDTGYVSLMSGKRVDTEAAAHTKHGASCTVGWSCGVD